MLGIVAVSVCATAEASAYDSGVTRITRRPDAAASVSSARTSSSATCWIASGAEMISVFEPACDDTFSNASAAAGERPARSSSSRNRVASRSRSSGCNRSARACLSAYIFSVVAGRSGACPISCSTRSTSANTADGPLTTSDRVAGSVLTVTGVRLPTRNAPLDESSRSVLATASRSARSSRYVRTSASSPRCCWSSERTICSKPARRFPGASTISEFVARSARTVISFGSRRSGRGSRVRGSIGIGGSGYIWSIVCANSSARAHASGKMRISRPSASSACVSFNCSTIASISGSRSGCADTISVFVGSSARTFTGCFDRSSGVRWSNDDCSTCARFPASVLRSLRIRSGGLSPA
ncbi:MAG: hypothetical protein AMXMBFR77_04970 [Phycisphaerales bacterium]